MDARYEGYSYTIVDGGVHVWECGCITLHDGDDVLVVEVCSLHNEETVGSTQAS